MQCRQEQRHVIDGECRVRTGPGFAQRVALVDLSSEGCALRSSRLHLRRSDRVELHFANSQRLFAEVRWVRQGESVGLRFLQSIEHRHIEEIGREARHAAIMGVTRREPIVLPERVQRRAC